jgi:hypothetical protein
MSAKSVLSYLLLVILLGAPQLRGEWKEAVYSHGDYVLKVSVERDDVLIKSETDILGFPGLIEFSGKLILPYGRGQHGGKEQEKRLSAVSTDGGKTWTDLPSDSPFNDKQGRLRGNAVQDSGLYGYMRDGTFLYMDAQTLNVPKDSREWQGMDLQTKNPEWRTRRFSKTGELVETFTTRLVGVPWETAYYENYGNILQLENGDLLTAFAHGVGKSEMGSVSIVRSTDGGRTFKFVTWFDPAAYGFKLGFTNGHLGEGFAEPDMAVLPNGDILCIVRTGHTCMYQFRSKDGGRTWSAPVSVGWAGVKPRLRVLKNGVLACISGRTRYGHPQVTYAMFSLDGTGEFWEVPFIFYTGPGSSYNWDMERDGKLYVVYSSADFSEPLGTYGLPYQSIRWAVLNVIKEKRK